MDENNVEKLLAEEEVVPAPASEEKPEEPATPEPKEEPPVQNDEEAVRKEEHLANLTRAIAEAQTKIKTLRTQKKQTQRPEEEELPKINLDDPSAKAWDKHIGERVNPLYDELEKEKEEVRTFALQEFLGDKPALSKNPEKVKELIQTYERIRTASERTREGVLLDLKKAYAAVFHEQLISAARQSRVEKAKEDILLSDIAVSRGATSYQKQESSRPVPLSEDDKKVLDKWGLTPEEWQEDKKKYG